MADGEPTDRNTPRPVMLSRMAARLAEGEVRWLRSRLHPSPPKVQAMLDQAVEELRAATGDPPRPPEPDDGLPRVSWQDVRRLLAGSRTPYPDGGELDGHVLAPAAAAGEGDVEYAVVVAEAV